MCLHNFLRNDNIYLNILDEEKSENQLPIFSSLPHIEGKSSSDAMEVRKDFTQYFMSLGGAVSWQENAVNAGILHT